MPGHDFVNGTHKFSASFATLDLESLDSPAVLMTENNKKGPPEMRSRLFRLPITSGEITFPTRTMNNFPKLASKISSGETPASLLPPELSLEARAKKANLILVRFAMISSATCSSQVNGPLTQR